MVSVSIMHMVKTTLFRHEYVIYRLRRNIRQTLKDWAGPPPRANWVSDRRKFIYQKSCQNV